MAADPNWAVLPSVILVDILSYLSHEDRIKASSVCQRWRCCLFHPRLWPKVNFQLNFSQRMKTKFLADRCGRFVREVEVNFCSHNITEVRECFRILHILKGNKNLQRFSLKPSSCHIEWPDVQSVYPFDRFLDGIVQIVRNSRKLQHFSLGCAEELLEHSNLLVSLLSHHHASNLKSIHLASVKEDSESYRIINFEPSSFQHFSALQYLSIDYDYMTNYMLEAIVSGNKAKLGKIIIHVHGVETDHERITDSTWRHLRNYNPRLEVTLNLIHSFDGVESILDILQPSMPLTHFRQLFCAHLNTTYITYFSTHYNNTLKSVYIVDGLMDGYPSPYESTTEEDPFVMLAWKCSKLQHFTLIGYEIADEDVIAMARLRGVNLQTFTIPQCCLVTVEEDEEDSVWVGHGCVGREFSQKVSENLMWEWHPEKDWELPLAVFDIDADAEQAYMDILHRDQHWDTLC